MAKHTKLPVYSDIIHSYDKMKISVPFVVGYMCSYMTSCMTSLILLHIEISSDMTSYVDDVSGYEKRYNKIS